MLGYTDIELKQTRFYQDVYTEGLKEGKAEGKAEGKREGKQEGESAIILRLLERRFGELPKNTRNTIERLQNQQLEALADRLWDINTLEALSDCLTQAEK